MDGSPFFMIFVVLFVCRAAQLVAAWQLGCEKNVRENEKMEREWRENEEMVREGGNGERFFFYISSFSLDFLPLYPFPISKIVSFCRKKFNIEILSRMS